MSHPVLFCSVLLHALIVSDARVYVRRLAQDAALREMWAELTRLRNRDEASAARKIQRVYRGHEVRVLYRIAQQQYRDWMASRDAAALAIQRAARRKWGRLFGSLYQAQLLAACDLQRVWRGHRARKS